MRELTIRLSGRSRVAAVAGLLVALAGCAPKSSGGSLPPTYSITGTVSGDVAQGVTVTLQGTSRTTTTDASGHYRFDRLSGGTFTIVPSFADYTFTPTTLVAVVNGASVAGQDFTATAPPPPPPPPPPAPPPIVIAGKVGGDGTAGMTMTLEELQPSTATSTVVTDTAGDYVFSPVTTGVYLVTPSRAGGWTFYPGNALVTVAGQSVTGPDFVSIAPVHALSGTVTGAIAGGVVLTLSGDADAVLVTTTAGSYAFTDLPPGNYVVTPSYPGYAFTPPSASVAMGTSDVTGQSFVSAATHKIAGRISGDVLAGVSVSLSGSAIAVSDPSGYFEFPDLVDGTYVLQPGLDGYLFAPSQRSVPLSGADVLDADFVASLAPPATYSLSGAVSGDVQRGVTISLLTAPGADPTQVATTDAAGAYRLDGVAPGTYYLIPSSDDYTFDPQSRYLPVAANVTGQDFTATLKRTARTITGTITGATTAGVTVTLVGPSPATTTQTTTSDASGSFAFRNLGDGLYLVTPAALGYLFTPSDCLVSISGPSVTYLQFTSVVAPLTISGVVTAGSVAGAGVAGVTLNLTGDRTASTVTAADGSYSFPFLGNGSYTVTPVLAGDWFAPAAAAVTLTGADAAGVDFVAAPAHLISGYVSGDVLLGVSVTLTGAAQGQTATDPTGYYEFPGLPDGGYFLTAALDGYTFDPKLLATDLAGADVTAANFTATAIPTYTVSGTIGGVVQAGVTVTLVNFAVSKTTTSDGAGAYSFTGVAPGSYMVIPSLGGYDFTPASRAFRVDAADLSSQDFTSAVAPP